MFLLLLLGLMNTKACIRVQYTQIFVTNIRFVFVRQSNILFGFPNICNKDIYMTLLAAGWPSPSRSTQSSPTSASTGSPPR